MKKSIITLVLSGVLLTACAKDAYELTSPMPTLSPEGFETQNVEGPAPIEGNTDEEAADEVTVEAEEPEETGADDAAAAAIAAGVVSNDFFSAHIKEFEIPEDEDASVRLVFEFTNTTDKTYYKNDDEIIAGGTWEKIIIYPLKTWKSNAEKGTESWIHYDLYEDEKNQEQIYKGGLKFNVAEDLSVAGMEMFED